MADSGYHFPHGISAGATRVTFYSTRWTNDWVSYDRAAYDSRVSWYSLSSYKEMFAEMYTAKYSGGTLPAGIGSNVPATFFASLEAASPEELGLESGGSDAGADAAGADAAADAGGAVAAPTQAEPQGDPNAGDIRPWP